MINELCREADKVLELGSGTNHHQNATTLDRSPEFNPDYVHDLTEFPWPDIGTGYDLIVLKDVQEHLPTDPDFLDKFFQEIEKRLSDDGRFYIRVPHFTSPEAAGDFQHTRNGYSFEAHLDYIDTSLQVKEKRLRFAKRKMLPWNYLIEPVANINIWFWEHSPLKAFPAKNLELVLTKKKG